VSLFPFARSPVIVPIDHWEPTLSEAFWQGLWQGVFQLAALGAAAVFANFVYQRWRDRSDARRELIDEIDRFSVDLYRPRKVYQSVVEPGSDCLARIADADQRERLRIDIARRALEEFTGVVGRFRALQIKLVPLFGFHEELFGHYLAVWRHLKEVRRRMESLKSLLEPGDGRDAADALYRLIDTFRYLAAVEPAAGGAPGRMQPPADVLERMRARGDAIHREHFGDA